MTKYAVCVDVETSGYKIDWNEITQIAAAAVDIETWNIVDKFSCRVFFDVSIADAEALEVNHYDPQLWHDTALDREVALDKFIAFINKYKSYSKMSKQDRPYPIAKLMGHNLQFDINHIRAMCRMFPQENGWGKYFPAMTGAGEYFDTIHLVNAFELVHGIDLSGRRLFELLEFFDVESGNATPLHDAAADVDATVALAKELTSLLKGDCQ